MLLCSLNIFAVWIFMIETQNISKNSNGNCFAIASKFLSLFYFKGPVRTFFFNRVKHIVRWENSSIPTLLFAFPCSQMKSALACIRRSFSVRLIIKNNYIWRWTISLWEVEISVAIVSRKFISWTLFIEKNHWTSNKWNYGHGQDKGIN